MQTPQNMVADNGLLSLSPRFLMTTWRTYRLMSETTMALTPRPLHKPIGTGLKVTILSPGAEGDNFRDLHTSFVNGIISPSIMSLPYGKRANSQFGLKSTFQCCRTYRHRLCHFQQVLFHAAPVLSGGVSPPYTRESKRNNSLRWTRDVH
jgi:hypothetical protein